MNKPQGFLDFVQQQASKLLEQTLSHISLTLASLFIAILIGVPLGILISKKLRFSGLVLGLAGILQTIPSIALLGFMIPLFGIGHKPAIVALFLYSLLPIIRNTFTGIREIEPLLTEAARGMGMTPLQILLKVEIPLAMPIILAGIRTAAVINVGVATLAAYIAAGGLGEFIFGGIALNNTNMILAGAIPAALLAILFDFVLSQIQKFNHKKLRLALGIFLCLTIFSAGAYFMPAASKKELIAGFTPEFMGRTDGYPGLQKAYDLKLKTVVISDAVMYKAAFEKELDIISGYSTDGRLKAFDLMILQDDQGVFPPYYAAPIIRKEIIRKYPELLPAINLLVGKISDSVMTTLNYQVDYLKQTPENVAKNFLIKNGLYKPAKNGKAGIVRIGSKIFGEQYILSYIYKMLITGNTDLKVETKTGLGGTKICFEALINNQIDMYPEYTGTGLLVILQPNENTLKSLKSKDEVYSYVKKEFDKRYKIAWLEPIGFNNAYAIMIRRQQAEELKLKTITNLADYLKTH